MFTALIHPMSQFQCHSFHFLVSFKPLPPLCVTVEFPPSWLPPSLSPLFVVSLSPLFSHVSFTLLYVSSCIFQHRCACGEFYLSHIASTLFRTHLINQIKAAFVKYKSLLTSLPNLYLNTKSEVIYFFLKKPI